MALEHVPIVAGIGELLWDCFEDGRRAGGAPANVAFHAQQLGCRGIVATRVGRDEMGDSLVQFLNEQGLETGNVQRDRDHPTGTVTIDTTTADHPQYTIHENVAWDYLQCDDSLREIMPQCSAVCFGTLAQRYPVSRDGILHALLATDENCRIVYDVNLRQNWYHRDWVERSLQMADILKLNRDEVDTIADLLEWKSNLPEDFAAAARKSFAVDLVCITNAEKGCSLFSRDDVVTVPGVEIELADSVGAGDAFTAALIYSQLQDWPLENCGQLANAVGAMVASRQGAMPPLGDEFAELVAQHAPRH